MAYLEAYKEGSILRIYVQPGASKNEIVGLHGDPPRLKIKVKAPPEDGKANNEVVSFLAKTLGVSKSQIQFLRGETSRQKDVFVNLTLETLEKLIIK